MLEDRIIDLKKTISEFAGLVERMLKGSFTALKDQDRLGLLQIIKNDEPKTNMLETQMDESCAGIIAQYGPKARDLRMILMIMKMSNDLERIADHIVNITESNLYLLEKAEEEQVGMEEIHRMAEDVQYMLSSSITAFVDENADLARRVVERDREVNRMRDAIVTASADRMGEGETPVYHNMHLLRISGNLERVADLTKNICEDVVFIVEGAIVKHGQGSADDKKE